MGWAKYMEDNLEIIQDRKTSFGYRREDAYFSVYYPREKIIPASSILGFTSNSIYTSERDQQEGYKDRYLICRTCGKTFQFTVQQQKNYDRKNWNPPKRCHKCRENVNVKALMRNAY